MRLLAVIHYPVFGGPHNRVLRLTEPLLRRGISTVALLPDAPGNAVERLRTAQIPVVTTSLHRVRRASSPKVHLAFAASLPREVAGIRRLIREERADAILVGGLPNPHGALAGHLEGRAVVWQVLDTRTPTPLRKAVLPIVDHCADAVMFAGRSLVAAHDAGRLRPPIFVCPPAVDTRSFRPSPAARLATRRQWGIPADAPVVGTVANINPQKGLEHFVGAAGTISRQQPETRFVVVGASHATHTEYERRLRVQAAQAGIPASHFVWAGERHDLEVVYPAFDVKVVSSVARSEGTPTTAMEAMACALPVVTTDAGAARELVLDGRTGTVVPPDDDAALATAVARLLADDVRRDAMGAAGRQRVVRGYDVELRADDYVALLQRALAHRQRRRRAHT